MKVVIAGGTGMVGKKVLELCLADDAISEVRSLVRRPTGQVHARLREYVVADFAHPEAEAFVGCDVAFFCLGAYTGSVSNELLKTITVDYAVAFAKALEAGSPGARVCLLSGAGADRSEKSRTPFALYKGMAENQIAALNLRFFTLRPGYIYPTEPRTEPNIGYTIMRLLYPVIRLLGRRYSVTSQQLAEALFLVGMKGAEKEVLENQDILAFLRKNVSS
ncbi:MAG TPA: NAD(P)H-binding protein [Flavobacterium sp.]|nr:NAD(P)H-binding protein [Flavobacterium sp.]